jgi:hypothetical protein
MKNFNERIMMKEQTPYLTIDSINTAREKISTAAKSYSSSREFPIV